LVDWNDPAKGIDWNGVQLPRYSTGYFPLVNRPSILVEMHAHKPYRDRVLANRDFMDALILEAGHAGEELVRAVDAAEARTVALGLPDADPSSVVVRWKTSEHTDSIVWPAFRTSTETSVVTGEPRLVYHRGEIEETELPFHHQVVRELALPRPRGYLVHAGWPQIERAIRGHGLVAEPLTETVTLELETIRLSRPVFADAPYQGAFPVSEVVVTRQTESREISAGSLWIPADQPDFRVAVQLFEPEAPDSLLRWGELSSIFEQKTYIGLARLEEIAVEMLADETVRSAWETALEDPEFADDRRARYMWWYRRTPFWDERVGLLPIYRVMTTPPFARGGTAE
jgi:hypothetical protein